MTDANKVPKTMRFDPLILEEIENFCTENNVNFSQALNVIVASFFAQHNKKHPERYLKIVFQNLLKGL